MMRPYGRYSQLHSKKEAEEVILVYSSKVFFFLDLLLMTLFLGVLLLPLVSSKPAVSLITGSFFIFFFVLLQCFVFEKKGANSKKDRPL